MLKRERDIGAAKLAVLGYSQGQIAGLMSFMTDVHAGQVAQVNGQRALIERNIHQETLH